MIKVGTVLSLSGRFALQGRQARRGLALWATQLNAAGGLTVHEEGGRLPVTLIVYDDQSRSAPAIAWAEHLIVADQVDLLVGPYSSVLTLAVAPVAEQHRKVLWNHSGASDALARYGFRFVVSLLSPASRYFVGILEMIQKFEPAARRIALLHGASGTFPQEVLAGVEAYAQDNDFQVVLKTAYPPMASGFAPMITRLVECHPDIILGAGRTEMDLAFARQLKAQRVAVCAIGLVATPLQFFKQTLGADTQGFVGPSQWEPGVPYRAELGPTSAEFVTCFRDHFQKEPDYPAAQAYAAGLAAQKCIEVAGTLRDEPVREVAHALAFTTFYGAFKLDPETSEQIGHTVVIVQWQGEVKRIVWPPTVAEAQPQQWQPIATTDEVSTKAVGGPT